MNNRKSTIFLFLSEIVIGECLQIVLGREVTYSLDKIGTMGAYYHRYSAFGQLDQQLGERNLPLWMQMVLWLIPNQYLVVADNLGLQKNLYHS